MADSTAVAEFPTAEGVTEKINRGLVDSIVSRDPEWLRERRIAAWEAYERTPMPTTKLEEWRYTDLRRKLKLDALSPLRWEELPWEEFPPNEERIAKVHKRDAIPAGLRAAIEADQAASGHLVMVDGAVVRTDLLEELAARGVVLTSLQKAIRTHPEVLKEYLATQAVPASAGKFQALNAALWTDGVLLLVPKNVKMDLPVRVTRWVSEAGRAFFSRTLIIAEAGSRVSFVDEILSDDLPEQTLVSSSVEVFARDEAQVQYVSLQRMGKGAFHLSQQRTLAGKDSTLDTLNVGLGASVARVDLVADLLGPGANSDMLGLYFGDGDQHFDHNTRQDHLAPNAKSDLLYKGALDGKARAVFRGIIKVHPGAQRTDAYQTNRNLLLSEHARADSLPNLEIEADDVKCSHGASVGQLDQEHLFYLMSRGLSRSQAERLVVLGFLGDVLSRLPLGGVAEKVTRIVEAKLHG